MRWYRWSLPLLSLAVTASSVSAQGIIVINPYVGGPSLGYTRPSRHSIFSISSGGYGYSAYPFGPPSSLGIIAVTPAPTSVIIVPRAALGLDDDRARDTSSRPDTTVRRENIPEPADMPPPEKPLPGQDAGEFRPLAADNRKQAERPIPAEVLAKKMDQELVPLPPPTLPEADPAAESARLVKLGKEAFAIQEYGRAAQRFRQATRVVPNDALNQFLLAQALVALGKYAEAVDAIYAGMALRPDWPTQPFQPRELYGQQVATYPQHLRRLEDTLTRFPNDPTLLFLFAYELWFDGRRDEARALFRRARPGVTDPAVIDRFLQIRPAVPPVIADAAAV